MILGDVGDVVEDQQLVLVELGDGGFAAAAAASWACQKIMHSLIWWSVMWRPRKV
jgi:hypothetical protein